MACKLLVWDESTMSLQDLRDSIDVMNSGFIGWLFPTTSHSLSEGDTSR